MAFGRPVLTRTADYDALCRQFRWPMPAAYNIGVEVCDRWADIEPRRIALIDAHDDGGCDEVGYGVLRDASNRLANALRAFGIARGDRVAILLPQGPDVAVSHIAIYKLAAIALPLAMLFGIDAISYRLKDSGAKALITNAQGLTKLTGMRDRLPNLVLSVDGTSDTALGFHDVLARASPAFTPEATTANDPALMVYTSGTTGQPKGALHAHRVLIGH
ncbi:MAG TPA: AMP-binding protein, partial [Xanthobacteraceae bacterium]|nr:AMP-binding protein [Xanthobacteraceae bacterium]